MKRILGYAARQWKLYIISIVTLVVGVNLEALGPQYVQRIVDQCIVGGNTEGFVLALLIPMLLVYLATGVFNYIQEYSSDCISAACQKVMRMDVYRSIMGKDTAFFRKNNPGELMSRTKQDIETVGFVMGFISLFAAQIVYHIIHIAICIIRISGVASIPAFVVMPIIAFLAIMSEPKGDKLSDKRSDVIADMNQSATESLSGIRTVKAFGREDTERRRFDKHNSMFRYYSRKIDYLWANWETPMSTLARIMLAASILISGIQVIKGNMTLGQLTTIAAYTSELSWPMMEVGWLLAEFSSASASQRKIRAIIDQKPGIVDGAKTLDEVHGNIRFDHVSYEVDGLKIIDDVSFDLQDGKVLGIMGSTGSGKTTLANLAMRFVDPTSGSVSTDGMDLRELDLASARKGKAIVTQDVFLFSDSVKANLEKGQKDKLSMEVMKKAAVDAAADEFVSKLSEGYETIIGEKGVGLSGGQKQRVAIARAFASGRPLLIFDDATSALDMETEKEVQRAIRRKAGCSMMVIAHRISAVRDADEIIFLENGRVAERGTHEQLLAQKGLYWQTYQIQYPDELSTREAK